MAPPSTRSRCSSGVLAAWLLSTCYYCNAGCLGTLLHHGGAATHGGLSPLATMGPGMQVLYSNLWNLTIMQQPLQLCAGLGSLLILSGVVVVCETSALSHQTAELERERSEISFERRAAQGKFSFIDRLSGRARDRSRLALIAERSMLEEPLLIEPSVLGRPAST